MKRAGHEDVTRCRQEVDMSHAVIHPTTDALPWPERPRPRLDAAR
ncbi:MAG: hypothetical protein JWP95_1558, partial [Actinotalea sp.]|nr:hypothetical protein [Actinotalea sp.]